jgi:hypothetical protein
LRCVLNPNGRRSRCLHVSIPYGGENLHFVEQVEEQCTAHLDIEDAIHHTELIGNGSFLIFVQGRVRDELCIKTYF